MLTRRELLGRATTTLLLIPIVSACSSNSSPSVDAAPACSGVETTSTTVEAHTHSLCVLTTDLTNPPAAGVTYTTTAATTSYGSHSHMVMLTQAQLTMIEAATEVTVTSSSVLNPMTNQPHTHDFMIVKA
jgi:hypothetical protein